MSWISRIANAFRNGRVTSELNEELQSHLDEVTDELVRGGMSRKAAEAEARQRLGNQLQLREASHELKSAPWLDSLLRDFGFGLRMLNKHRTTSGAAIVSLALAIGACTAAFSVMDALIFRPLPVADAAQLIDLARLMPAFMSPDNQPRESDSFSYPQYELFRESAHDSADLFAMSLSGGFQTAQFDDSGGANENIRVESISGRGFQILGVNPALGRMIEAEDDAKSGRAVAVLSNAFWKRRFGGSPSAIGRWVTLGRKQYQIVGVSAGEFSGVQPGYLTDVWLPLSAALTPQQLADPNRGLVNIWGRLRPGTDSRQVLERLQPVLTNDLRERMRINPPRNLQGAMLQQVIETPLRVRDASSGRNSLFRMQFRRPMWILAIICMLLLLIACSNVANLMIARASARTAEMALRVSLGAARLRLMQQMLMESGQLAGSAFVIAVTFAAFAAPAMVMRLGSTEFPAWLNVNPDGRTITFAAGLSLIAALLFGIVPAVRASSVTPGIHLKNSGRGHSMRRGWLSAILSAQVGFSFALLFLSGLLLHSFYKLTTVDLGFVPDNVVLFDLMARDPANRTHQSGTEMLQTLRQLPGVQSASVSQQRPMGGDMVWIMTPVIRMPGKAVEAIRPIEVPVSAGFFTAMRMRWIAGRDFLPEEMAANSQSVIVNQLFADKFFPGKDPVGQRFEKLTDDPDPISQQIVGVVGNARYNNLREREGPAIYTPLRDLAGATVNIRTTSRASSLIPTLGREVESAAPRMMVRGSIPLETQIDNTLTRERLLALLAGFFSVVALLLAGVGLYGVVHYATVRRTREIGIRMALGAERSGVVRLIVSEISVPIVAGLVIGMACGAALSQYLTSQLYAVQPMELWSVTPPMIWILLAATCAVLPVALRASAADPLLALREE